MGDDASLPAIFRRKPTYASQLYEFSPAFAKPEKRPPKIVLYASDMAATRAVVVKRGAKMGKVVSAKKFDMCNGRAPDGNPFQLSNRQ